MDGYTAHMDSLCGHRSGRIFEPKDSRSISIYCLSWQRQSNLFERIGLYNPNKGLPVEHPNA
jgi:hypothetical protein